MEPEATLFLALIVPPSPGNHEAALVSLSILCKDGNQNIRGNGL